MVPSLDTGVSGTVSATVNTVPLLTIASTDTSFKTYQSDSNDVKFTDAITIEAPGSQTVNCTVTVNKVVAPANAHRHQHGRH